MLLDDEVFAVIMAVVIVACIFAIVETLGLKGYEPFVALGLLNEKCKIGYYPREALIGSNITLCIFVDNHMGHPIYYKVVYKIATPETLPTNTTPSPQPPLLEWRGVLDDSCNTTFLVKVPVLEPALKKGYNGTIATLVFELWVYREGVGWVYTGRWNHLHIHLVRGETG